MQPRRLQSPSGLAFQLNANGSIRRMEHADVTLNLFPGNEVEGGPTNVWVRRLGEKRACTPLLGPGSPLRLELDDAGLRGAGTWNGVGITLSLVLARTSPAWFWHVALENRGDGAVELDLVYAQDLGLAPYGAIRMNEYYVSQYLDHVALSHAARGPVLATRQNMAVGGRYPWTLIGSLGRAVSWATDALQLHGLATRAGDDPAALVEAGLPGVRKQHEHAMAVLQDAPVQLAPGASAKSGFFGWLEPDHPAATSSADVALVERALSLPEATPPSGAITAGAGTSAPASLFSKGAALACRDLSEAEIAELWGSDLRHVERADGKVLSFFAGEATHVALRTKELVVLRPHGRILRTGSRITPDESALTTTAWMSGTFNCLLTQGHVGINRLLSTTRSYLGLQRSHAQRIFVEVDGGWQLLDVPSAWEAQANACRWIYAHAGGRIEVRVTAAEDRHAIDLAIAVTDGPAKRFLVSNHLGIGNDDGAEPGKALYARDGDGLAIRPPPETDVGRRFPDGSFRIDPLPGTRLETVGSDELLFEDGATREQPFVVLVTGAVREAGFRFTGKLVAADGASGPSSEEVLQPLRLEASGSGHENEAARIQDIVPWYVHDALVHYLAPRGLEQFSGGGWGTRDVCQGPVELLSALGADDSLRDLLLRVFANQNVDGDWPQWFMFFERERSIRPGDSHGDIVFWPVFALAKYVLATEDASFLDEVVPFFDAAGVDKAERATLWAHVERALGVIRSRVIPGTSLAAYGNGDWNDSLQPADPSMRERLCSSWTVTLQHQTLATLSEALRRVGREGDAKPLDELAARIRADFSRCLIADGTLAGFAYFQPDGRIDHWLHPEDRTTGIHYRLLPMIHAIIADLLTPEQAKTHVGFMRDHLIGADGGRLFDRPPMYRGGPQKNFQRAESSSFFGREIGIMYTHAHLRYAESMARFGDAEALFEALRRANPIALGDVVPAARRRQANCYYSSSDAVVADRYEASERYPEIRAGRVPLEGGWRVYSSGAGIAVRLVHECFLGIRRGRNALGIDPVIPKSLDGLVAEIALEGRRLRIRYRIASHGYGPTAVTLNGKALPTSTTTNPYRKPGVTVPMAAVRAGLGGGANELVVDLG